MKQKNRIMKTQVLGIQGRTNQTTNKNILHLMVGICLIATVAFSSVFAQSNGIEVKGMVSDEIGPLTGVNIALEGSNTGAITDTEGTFIFPKALQIGDVLIFSYLGYKTLRIKIKEDSSFLNIKMETEAIDIVGAPSVNKPYKTKRSR